MTALPPRKSVVVCTEHQGAHVGIVAAHIGTALLGIAWGLTSVPENRVHAKDGASCAPQAVRVVDEASLTPAQNEHLRLIRRA